MGSLHFAHGLLTSFLSKRTELASGVCGIGVALPSVLSHFHPRRQWSGPTSVLIQPSAKRNIGIYFGQLQILLVERFISFILHRIIPLLSRDAFPGILPGNERFGLSDPVKRLCSAMREKGMPSSGSSAAGRSQKSGSSQIPSSKCRPRYSNRPGFCSKAF